MIWDASLADMKSALDGRLVDLQNTIEQCITAVNCYDYEKTMEAFDGLCRLADESRDLYDAINEKEQEMIAEEYQKKWEDLV